eukprot:SAG31_NODE_11194_length_1056_cov_1.170324_1_plen_266_part_01
MIAALAALAVLAESVPAPGTGAPAAPHAPPSRCKLADMTWSYMAPANFEGVPANNEAGCLYTFKADAAGDGFTFSSPAACRGDSWRLGTGTVSPGSSGRQVLLKYAGGDAQKPLQHRGWVTPDCQFIDMDDGGLYIRGRHPFDMAPHEWIRVATAWVMRAAMITFKDGSRHITPGVPKPVAKPRPNDGYYVGQWMRDGFYGISVRSYFLVLCPLFEKYGTFIAGCNALIEKVSPCIRTAGIWLTKQSTKSFSTTPNLRFPTLGPTA